MSHDFLGVFAAILSAFSGLIYVIQILRGKLQPERASWFIWSVVGFIVFFSYMLSGATSTIWIPLVMAVLPLIVFTLSLKYGVGGWSRFDQYILGGAGIALLIWSITGSPLLGLISISIVDIAGISQLSKKF